MMNNLWRNLTQRTSRSSRRARRRPVAGLLLERLEDRSVPAITAVSGVTLSGVEGTPLGASPRTVATFTDTNPALTNTDYTVTTNWGDGTTPTTSTVVNDGAGNYHVEDNHTYTDIFGFITRTFPVAVSIAELNPPNGTFTASGTAAITDAPLSPGTPFTGPAPVPFAGVGTVAAGTAFTNFKTALGGADNGNTAAPQAGGFRTINWDGVKLDGTFPGSSIIDAGKSIAFPLNGFQTRGIFIGAVYSVSGDGFQSVTGGTSAGLFPAFSPSNVFSMFNNNVINVRFVVPSANSAQVPAATRGFGAILLNTRTAAPNTTKIEFFAGNTLIDTAFATGSATAGDTEFVGRLFANPVVTNVKLTLGDGVIFRFNGTTFTGGDTDLSNGGAKNLVATDDWGYAEPVAIQDGFGNIVPPLGAGGAPLVTSGSQGTLNGNPIIDTHAGVPFTGVVARFFDSNPSATDPAEYTARIKWGDGHESTGTVTRNTTLNAFEVSGTNTYAQPGQYPIDVDVAAFGGFRLAVSNMAAIDSNLNTTLTPVPVTGVEGAALTNVILARFADTNPAAVAGDFTATVNWGDGSATEPATVAADPNTAGSFIVTGTHTYNQVNGFITGKFNVTVAVTETAAALTATKTTTATITDAPLSPGLPVNAGTPVEFLAGDKATATTAFTDFKTALGGADNGNTAAPQAAGFRTINWDGVKLDGTFPGSSVIDAGKSIAFPLNGFQTRGIFIGAVYSVSGDGFQSVTGGGTAGLFPPFSPNNVFSMFNNNVINVRFVVPSANSAQVPAATRGFGAIFLNVQTPNTTSIEYFNGNTLIKKVFAPVGAPGETQFVGEVFADPIVTNVRLTLGDGVIFRFTGTDFSAGDADLSKGGTKNLVATDDWGYAEPVAIQDGFGNIVPPLVATGSPLITSGSQGTLNGNPIVSPSAGTAFTGVVARFTDSNPTSTDPKDYTARIKWGDGHESVATITRNTTTNAFEVSGTNTYAQPGLYPIDVDVAAFGGFRLAISNEADVRRSVVVTGPDSGLAPNVRVFDGKHNVISDFLPYSPALTGGVRVATGDVNGDGVPDTITVPGPGGPPDVHVIDGKTGTLIRQYFAFDQNFLGGLYVAAGDVNADGFDDVVVGADAGGGANILISDGKSIATGQPIGIILNAFPFGQAFTGGVRVATGDVDGDGHSDLITGAGPGGGPNVTIISGADGKSLIRSYFVYAPEFTGGIYVGTTDVDGDGKAEVITGAGFGGGPNVVVSNGLDGTAISNFFAYDVNFFGGVRVGGGDVNGDGKGDVITGPGPGAPSNVKVFNIPANTVLDTYFAYDQTFTGGIFVAGGR